MCHQKIEGSPEEGLNVAIVKDDLLLEVTWKPLPHCRLFGEDWRVRVLGFVNVIFEFKAVGAMTALQCAAPLVVTDGLDLETAKALV